MPQVDEPGSWRNRAWRWAMPIALVILVVVSAYAFTSLRRERRNSQQLVTANHALNLSMQQMQNQIRSVSDQLKALEKQPAPEAATERSRLAAKQSPSRKKTRAAAARPPARTAIDDARWRQVQEQVASQQKDLADTRQQLDQTRQDFEKNLNSTRDELNGSIAKNHDELVVLQKRGDRNIYEFTLDKAKQFRHVGPFSLSLRKVNQKHRYYDLVMTVEDQQLERKNVSLYEPLMVTLADRPQPVELVVNQIDKNAVKGYISEPKYKKSELASTTSNAPADTTPALQRR